jgi:hypothetical protein
MVVSPDEAIYDVGHFWESMGGVWGGRFDDPIHFEYPGFSAARQQPSLANIENLWPFPTIRALLDFFDALPWYISMWFPWTAIDAKRDPAGAVQALRNAGLIK